MNFRLANLEDLPKIYEIFAEIISDMNKNKIEIWDELYPCSLFKSDIEQGQLYLLCDGDTIVSVLALADGKDEGEGTIEWQNSAQRAKYVLRFGVNVRCRHRGLARLTLEKAAELARSHGAEVLRLLVVDFNTPARNLYEKCGFALRPGEAILQFDDGSTLRELGMELAL